MFVDDNILATWESEGGRPAPEPCAHQWVTRYVDPTETCETITFCTECGLERDE